MLDAPLKILLVEDNPGDARLIREMLADSAARECTVEWVSRLADALEVLDKRGIDLVLLDLGLPDSLGLETFSKAYTHSPGIPFVLLTGLDDETLALNAVRQGAQDYLIKGETDANTLFRAIRYAAERKKAEEALRRARDDLEIRVRERTADLLAANQQLQEEIAKRRQTEAAREAERQRLYDVLEMLPVYVILLTPDYHISFANRTFRESFGDSGRRRCYEFLFGLQQPCQNCRAFPVLTTGQPQEWEWTGPNQRHYQVFDYPFTDSDGSPLILEMGLDITERQAAEHALRLAHDHLELKVAMRTAELAKINLDLQLEIEERQEIEEAIKDREEQLTAIYENAPVIMMLVDSERRVRKVNKLAEQFAGASNADLIGRRGGEALRCLHALDDPKGCGFGPYCQDCTVRRTVIETFETGCSCRQMEACLPFALEGNPHEVTFLLCTALLAVRGEPQVLVTIQDITKRKLAEDKLRVSEKELRFLASQLLTAQERERERISRELHDELGQSLLVLKLQAGHIAKRLDKEQPDLKGACQELMQQFDRLVAEVRRLARDLSPTMVRDLGLASALKRLIQDFARHYGLQAEIDLLDGLDELFSREAQINIYRIFQESLTNIGKYAEASQLRVAVRRADGSVVFQVADNGSGFRVAEVWGRDPARRGLGLMAMEERARMLGGTLEIQSREGQGTELIMKIPVDGSQAD